MRGNELMSDDGDRWCDRLGGAAAIGGALVGLGGNLLHPVTPAESEGAARAIAASDMWVAVHVALVIAFPLMIWGLAAVRRRLIGGASGALADFGLIAAVAGGAAGIVAISIDGFALKHLAGQFSSGAAPQIDFAAYQAAESIAFSLLTPLNIVFGGLAFGLFGLAVAWSGRYRPWTGWLVALAGLAGAVSGILQASIGESSPVTLVLGIASPTIYTLWLLGMGIVLVRTPSDQTSA
jgi:hypothetical protein